MASFQVAFRIREEIGADDPLRLDDFAIDAFGPKVAALGRPHAVVVQPTHYGMSPDWPAEALVTATFAEHDGQTKFTLRHAVGSAPASERDQCQVGWAESLDRLAGYLARA